MADVAMEIWDKAAGGREAAAHLVFVCCVCVRPRIRKGPLLPYNTRHKNRSRHFSFEFLFGQKLSIQNIKDLIPNCR
jgi:hypothetical protein